MLIVVFSLIGKTKTPNVLQPMNKFVVHPVYYLVLKVNKLLTHANSR